MLGENFHILEHGGHHELCEDHSLFHVNIWKTFIVELERDGGRSSVNLSLWSDLIRRFETVVRSDGVPNPGDLRYAEEVRNSVLVEPAFE